MANVVNPDSILFTIKSMLGLALDYDAFDTDIIVHINTALMTLQQLGVGPEGGLFITGPSESWQDLIPSGQMLEAAKTYIYAQVRMVFDPPTNSFVMDSLQKTCDRLEWRLKEQARFFDGNKKQYVRSPMATGSVMAVGPSGELVLSEEASGVVQCQGSLGGECCMPVHIERDGITPIDDIGQNVCMKGDCCG